MQKGGTVGLLLVVFAILVVTIWGGYYIFKGEPEEVRAPTPLVEAEPTGQKNVRATRSFVILDGGFAYTPSAVYYESGSDTDGEPLYTILAGADPKTFEKIGTVAPPQSSSASTAQSSGSGSGPAGSGVSGSQSAPSVSQQSNTQTQLGSAGGSGTAGTPYSITFYSDSDTVYMVITSGGETSTPQIVPGADPDTFAILNAEYSKDENSVYVIIVTCTDGTCTAVVSIVAGADPDTFQAFPSTQSVMNSDCTGYVAADGQDANNVYNNGQVVDGVSVYLIGQGGNCDNTPVLISP